MKQSADFIDAYEHQDGSEVMDIVDTMNPDEFYGQVIFDGEKLVSEKEWELAQKESRAEE